MAPRQPPSLSSSMSESASVGRGAVGIGADFAQLPNSPEHMGLKAHAAEFVPGGGGAGRGAGGEASSKGTRERQQAGGGGGGAGGGGGVGGMAAAVAAATGGRGGGAGLGSTDGAPGSDLTAYAREFVPGGASGSGGGGGGGADDDKGGNAAVGFRGGGHAAAGEAAGGAGGGVGSEKMVQVVRGGTIYFVPESEALATDQLVAPEAYGPEEDGFTWAHGSAAMAAHQRRTMHRQEVET